MSKDIKKIVLSYSGGLDTSIMLKWLQETYECEVVTFTADLGQGEELEPARKKAEMFGIKDIRIVDVREEFVRDFVFPMFRANALYEGQYLLGTSIARPVIAKHLVEIAEEVGADAIAHGATGKGNDQVRFELTANALEPGHQGHRAVARMGPAVAHRSCSTMPKSTRSRSPRTSAAKRRSRSMPICCTPRRRAWCSRIRQCRAPDYVPQRTVDPEKAPERARDHHHRL